MTLTQQIIEIIHKVIYIFGLVFIVILICLIFIDSTAPVQLEGRLFGIASTTIEFGKDSIITEETLEKQEMLPLDRERAITTLREFTPKDITSIDVIIESYYDLTLYYGNYTDNSIFKKAGTLDADTFFNQFIPASINGEERITLQNEIFKEAFFEPSSPAWAFELPRPTNAAIGGHVVGRKYLDSETMLVYSVHESQEHLGPTSRLCKNTMNHIDKFIFRNIEGEWKIWEITENIDSWDSQKGGYTEEECTEINQDNFLKYKIGEAG